MKTKQKRIRLRVCCAVLWVCVCVFLPSLLVAKSMARCHGATTQASSPRVPACRKSPGFRRGRVSSPFTPEARTGENQPKRCRLRCAVSSSTGSVGERGLRSAHRSQPPSVEDHVHHDELHHIHHCPFHLTQQPSQSAHLSSSRRTGAAAAAASSMVGRARSKGWDDRRRGAHAHGC